MSDQKNLDEDIDIDMTEAAAQPPAAPQPPRTTPPPQPAQPAIATANAALGLPQNPLPRTASSPAIPGARPQTNPGITLAMPLTAQEATDLIGFYEREARALGSDPGAARLFHEMGLLWEDQKNPRNAAVCYQNAYKLAPKYVPNIQSARRLFGEVGNWQMVAQLFDAEIAACETDPEKAALMFEKALVLEERLGKSDDALALLVQCREKAPEDPGVLTQLEAAYIARADWANVKAVRLALAELVKDPALQAHYLASAALLCEARLGQAHEAAELIYKAFAINRDDPALVGWVKRAAEGDQNTDVLLAALLAEAQGAGAGAAPTYYRMARVYEQAGKQADAVEALLAARKVAPEDPLILTELSRHYEATEKWDALADVLRARVSSTTDDNELIAMNLRLGALFAEKLNNEDDAIARYRSVLAVSKGHTSAISALGRLYARKKNWEGLLETYEADIAAADDPKLKAAHMYKAAELLEQSMGRDDDAVSRYRAILELQPGYLPALKALTRIFERTERWADLVGMWEQELTETKDRDQIIALLSRIADTWEQKLKDPEKAAAAFKRILDVAQDHLPTIRSLARLCERAGMWEELIRTNELESALVGDTRQVISLLHRNAEIYEEKLKNREQALETYQKVLSLSASYLPGLKALGRLYAQTQRWQELCDMYRQEAEITTSTEQAAALIYKAGEVFEEKLGQIDPAIAAYQEVLTLSPSHFPALRALSRIYRHQKAFEPLVEVLRAEAAARKDPAERAQTLFQVATLWEDDLSRVDLAIASYLEVLALQPTHAPSIRALERLYTREGKDRELFTLLENEAAAVADPKDKVAALTKVARLAMDKLNEPNRALALFQRVLGIDPTNLAALKGVELLEADRGRRSDLRLRLASAVKDPRASAALRVAAAMDRERGGGGEVPVAELKKALEAAPNDPRVHLAVERALRKAGDHAALAEILEKRLAVVTQPEPRLALVLRIAELYERNLGRLDRALAAYRAALELDPKSLVAIRGARRILTRSAQFADVYKLWLAEGRACAEAKAAMDALYEAGRVAQTRLNDLEGAKAAYGAVLEKDPLEPRATTALEELLAASGGAADLAAMHMRRGQTRAATHDSAAAAEEFYSAAQVFAGTLKDAGQALVALEQTLAHAPTHVAALQLKGELCYAAQKFADAAQAWGRRIEQGGDARELAALHHRLGTLFHDHLGDAGRAVAHFMTVLQTEPRHMDSLERVANIHLAARNWPGAADAVRRLTELEKDPKKLAGHHVNFARLAEEGFGDANAAASHYKRALDLAPGDAAIIDKLAVLFEKLGNLQELVTLIEQQSVNAASAGDKPRASTLRVRAAELYLKLNDAMRAVQAYRFAIDLHHDSIPARSALADLLARDGSANSAAIEEHKNLLKLEPLRMDSYHTLYRLFSTARQNDRAVITGHVLSFFKAMTEAEQASWSEAKGRVPQDTQEVLSQQELDVTLAHPGARHPLSDVMRIVGDQLIKVYEPTLEAQGVTKADRLKPDHAIYKLIKNLLNALGVEKFDLYMGKKGAQITVENTDPMSLVIGPDVVRRFNAREQRFLFARAGLELRNKMALARRLDANQLADLLGNSIRVVQPDFNKLGRPDAEASKKLRKAMSGKAIKALEQLASDISQAKSWDVGTWLQAQSLSADRAGLILANDPSTVLQLLLREDPSVSGNRLDSTEAITAFVKRRRDMLELLVFSLGDDFFKLRNRLKLGLQ